MSVRRGVVVLLALLVGAAALALFLVRVALGLAFSMDGSALLALFAFGLAVVLVVEK